MEVRGFLLGFLAVCCSVIGVVHAQNRGCAGLDQPYVLGHLRNVTLGLSSMQDFRSLALQPLMTRTRVAGTRGSQLARTHIKTWMSVVGWTVEEDRFYANTPYGVRPFSNVVATLDPSKSRRVVLACHYDSKLMHGIRFLGASDAAVPCALLLDWAWRLKDFFMASKEARDSDLTLQFIFFDGEEAFVSWSEADSLYGSRHLADLWSSRPDPNNPHLSYTDTIDMFVLLDLIGTSDTHFNVRFQETMPAYYKLQSIESCMASRGLLRPTEDPRPLFTTTVDLSHIEDDHTPFYQRGVPILHLITSPFPRVWHTARDDLPAMDFPRIDNLASIFRLFFLDLPLWG